MSGIAGICQRDGRPVDSLLLDQMGWRLAHRGPDGEFKRVQGCAGMICRLNRIAPESMEEVQPLTDSSGAMLVFDGRLDNREELLARLRDSEVSKSSSDPELVLAAYHAWGERLPEQLNGDFALALYDPRERKLLLARDSLGIRPLYYAQAGDSFIFASEVKALLAHPEVRPCPNDDLFADFFLGQVYDQEITFFKDVFSVAPAHAILLTPKGLIKRRYWDFDPKAQVRFSSFQEYAEAFREIFERAVLRRLRCRHPAAVSLSGGLDSSSIYCMAQTLSRHGDSSAPDVIGASYISRDGTPSDEKAFLLDIEKAYGAPIDRLPTHSSGFLDGAEQSMWHMEMPMLDQQWGHMQQFLRRTRQQGARVLLTGHWADQFLFDQAYLVDLFRQMKWRMLAAHLGEFKRWMTDVAPSWFRERFILDSIKHSMPFALVPIARKLRRPRRHPWFSAALHHLAFKRQWGRARIGLQFRSAHGRSLYEQARTGYHVLCMEWQNKIGAACGLEMAFPFLDRDLISFLMAIPGEMQTHQGIPKALLRQSMRRILPASIANRRWKADFTYLANEAVKGDFDRVMHLIRFGKAQAGGYLNEGRLRTKLESIHEDLSGSSAESAWDISEIASLEIWLRVFCGSGHHGQEGSAPYQEPERIAEAKA